MIHLLLVYLDQKQKKNKMKKTPPSISIILFMYTLHTDKNAIFVIKFCIIIYISALGQMLIKSSMFATMITAHCLFPFRWNFQSNNAILMYAFAAAYHFESQRNIPLLQKLQVAVWTRHNVIQCDTKCQCREEDPYTSNQATAFVRVRVYLTFYSRTLSMYTMLSNVNGCFYSLSLFPFEPHIDKLSESRCQWQ